MVSSFENIIRSTEAREVSKELCLVIQRTVSSFDNILLSTEAREVGRELYLVIQRTVSSFEKRLRKYRSKRRW
jgi:hypothetical protein